jgi:hypothetical protein
MWAVEICCALETYLLENKEMRCSKNTTPHLSMPVRHFSSILQTHGAFTNEKLWVTIKKVYSAIGH